MRGIFNLKVIMFGLGLLLPAICARGRNEKIG